MSKRKTLANALKKERRKSSDITGILGIVDHNSKEERHAAKHGRAEIKLSDLASGMTGWQKA